MIVAESGVALRQIRAASAAKTSRQRRWEEQRGFINKRLDAMAASSFQNYPSLLTAGRGIGKKKSRRRNELPWVRIQMGSNPEGDLCESRSNQIPDPIPKRPGGF